MSARASVHVKWLNNFPSIKARLRVLLWMREWVSVVEICPCWAPLLADPDLIFPADATYFRVHIPELWSSSPTVARNVLDQRETRARILRRGFVRWQSGGFLHARCCLNLARSNARLFWGVLCHLPGPLSAVIITPVGAELGEQPGCVKGPARTKCVSCCCSDYRGGGCMISSCWTCLLRCDLKAGMPLIFLRRNISMVLGPSLKSNPGEFEWIGLRFEGN